jgi:hypothetical protein
MGGEVVIMHGTSEERVDGHRRGRWDEPFEGIAGCCEPI